MYCWSKQRTGTSLSGQCMCYNHLQKLLDGGLLQDQVVMMGGLSLFAVPASKFELVGCIIVFTFILHHGNMLCCFCDECCCCRTLSNRVSRTTRARCSSSDTQSFFFLFVLKQTKYAALLSVGFVCYNLCVYVGTGSTRWWFIIDVYVTANKRRMATWFLFFWVRWGKYYSNRYLGKT